jgi:hypothetical protein
MPCTFATRESFLRSLDEQTPTRRPTFINANLRVETQAWHQSPRRLSFLASSTSTNLEARNFLEMLKTGSISRCLGLSTHVPSKGCTRLLEFLKLSRGRADGWTRDVRYMKLITSCSLCEYHKIDTLSGIDNKAFRLRSSVSVTSIAIQ